MRKAFVTVLVSCVHAAISSSAHALEIAEGCPELEERQTTAAGARFSRKDATFDLLAGISLEGGDLMAGLAPALYGPEGDQAIQSQNYVLIDVPAGYSVAIEFQIPQKSEFAIEGYNERALSGQGAEHLFERGNYSRSQDNYYLPAQQEVRFVITGWFKDGDGPDGHKPWLQSRHNVMTTTAHVSTGTVTVIHSVAWGDNQDKIHFKGATVAVTLTGPA